MASREDILGTWSITRWMWSFAALFGVFSLEALIVKLWLG